MKQWRFASFRLQSVLRAALPMLAILLLTGAALLVGKSAAKTASAKLIPELPLLILDAGHGGEDGGAVADDGTMEKDVNLSLTLKLDQKLRALGFQTLLTRDSDALHYGPDAQTMRAKKVADLQYRLSLTTQQTPCVLLSIHQNQFSDPRYDGAQMFYSPNDPRSAVLAQCLQTAIREALQPDNTRLIKQSGKEIFLLYQTTVPAVMTECGFLSNPQELAKLKDDAYQQQMADAIVNGLLQYLTRPEEPEESDATDLSDKP